MSCFICMIKICISVTSHALYPLPLSQTVTPSQTPSPSSVTYFMDGPYTRLYLHATKSTSVLYDSAYWFSRYLFWSLSNGLVVPYFAATRLYSRSVLARIAHVSSDPASSVALFLNAVAFRKSLEHYEVFLRCFRAATTPFNVLRPECPSFPSFLWKRDQA